MDGGERRCRKRRRETRILYFCRMKKSLCFAVLLACSIAFAQAPDTLKLVDPMIGTGPDGHTFPGATAPFGHGAAFARYADSPLQAELQVGGRIRYEDTTIQGFSHTHFSGAGHSDLGDVMVMPVSGETVPLEPGDVERTQPGYRSRFSHNSERRRAGLLCRDPAKTRRCGRS